MLFYKTADGGYFTEDDLTKAFHICSGHSRADHDTAYFAWVENLIRGGVIFVTSSDYVRIEDLAKSNGVLATKLYREKTGCSLREAYDHIRELRGFSL